MNFLSLNDELSEFPERESAVIVVVVGVVGGWIGIFLRAEVPGKPQPTLFPFSSVFACLTILILSQRYSDLRKKADYTLKRELEPRSPLEKSRRMD